jgi:F-box protein 9
VPGTAHHSLHGSGPGFSSSLKQLLEDFSTLRIEAAPPPTDASPQERSPLGELPEEILTQILTNVAVEDVASFARMATVCKRMAYLVFTEESIWKVVATRDEYGFPAMHYDYVTDIEGFSLEANNSIARYLDNDFVDEEDLALPPTPEQRSQAFSIITDQLLHSHYASSWRQMFRLRPRIRFNGCYISTVNYTRPGATSTNTLTWGAPVHVVTYFRYLRFFRDGTCISLLTTSEPADVVHHLIKDNLHGNHHSGSLLPSAVMKDALRGRWRLTGPFSSAVESETGEPEQEGEVVIETEGVVTKYIYKLVLSMSHAGKGARNNKLGWKWFGSWNRLTDDWGEFGLKNDRAFYWSRVKSYGTGM